jgi:hypothetical protein
VNQEQKPSLGLNGLPRKRCPHREIEECLAQLRRCYWGGDDAFSWPSRELLSRLHNNVNELARTCRKRPFDDPWKAYLCVERDFPCLRLLRVLRDLVSRSLEKFRAKIQVNPEQILVYRIQRIGLRSGANGQLAHDLLAALRLLNAGAVDRKNVDWARFEPLLRDPGKSYIELAIGNRSGSPLVLCYARALEAVMEFRRIIEQTACMPLVHWLHRSAARELAKDRRDLVIDFLVYLCVEPTNGRELERKARADRERGRAVAHSRQYRAKKRALLNRDKEVVLD